MSNQKPTQEELHAALTALQEGFTIEMQETDFMGKPEPVLLLRGPAITTAVVKQLHDEGLIQPTEDVDVFGISDNGMAKFHEHMRDVVNKACGVPYEALRFPSYPDAYIAEGHGLDIPPPKQLCKQ